MNIWKIVIGLALLATGTFFILANLGVIPQDYSALVQDYWPLTVVLFGVALLIDGITKKGSRSKRFDRIFFSLSVMAVGLVLLENRIHYYLQEDVELWGVLLSLFLIFVGIRLIFFKKSSIVVTVGEHGRRSRHVHRKSGEYIINSEDGCEDTDACDDDEDEDEDDEGDGEDGERAANASAGDGSYTAAGGPSTDGGRRSHGTRRGVYTKNRSDSGKSTEQFVGELRLGDKAWAPESGEYSVNVGEMNVDLTTAILEDGETDLNLTGWIGEINIILPEELAVDITATVSIGSVEFFGEEEQSGISRNNIRFRSDDYATAVKKVRIKATMNVGEISVKRV
jgi:lia operon protein LiaF